MNKCHTNINGGGIFMMIKCRKYFCRRLQRLENKDLLIMPLSFVFGLKNVIYLSHYQRITQSNLYKSKSNFVLHFNGV